MSYSGYNQDDSVIINKSSIERGLFASSYFKSYDGEEVIDTRNNSQDFFYNPNDELYENVKKKNEYNYNNVDQNGLVKEGTFVHDNDVLISKYTKEGAGSLKTMKDCSVGVKMDGWGVVDKVFSDYYNSDKQKIARVRICTYRNPSLGDKFASRHGQKGVIGMILPQEDMPYTKDGIVPDIIINPHAIPSRMTLGQLVETVMGKSCSMLGLYADATPFTNIDNNEIFNILEHNCQFQRHGDEVLYSGINGKQMSTKIFIGPTYYQRLKHQVRDKVNSRATGAVSLKTKQPPSGRSVGGGLRIGEMERDAILSHGALQFLKETMIERSDKYSTYISANSGMTSIVNPIENKYICPSMDGPLEFNDELSIENDNSSCDIVKVNIPYNTNLMIQECNAMGISMRLILDNEATYDKLDVSSKPAKFELQDSDMRKLILAKKDTKKKLIIPKTPKNKTKFLNKMTNNKIIVTELTENITNSDLHKLFGTVGPIFDVKINDDNSAIIIYTKDDHAKQAIIDLNNVLLDGNRIVVSLFTGDISKPIVEPLNMYGSVGWQGAGEIPMFDPEEFPQSPELSPGSPSYLELIGRADEEEISDSVPKSPTQLSYEENRRKVIQEEQEYYKTIQSPLFEPSAVSLPDSQSPTADYQPDYLKEFTFDPSATAFAPSSPSVPSANATSLEPIEPDYSVPPNFDFDKELASVNLDNGNDGDYFAKTYGETKIDPIEPYVPDNTFMEELEKKEAAIKKKYQKGGGDKLNYSQINLGHDNLLSDVTLDGGSTSNLSDLNNLTIQLNNAPTPTSEGGSNSNPSNIKNITINLSPNDLVENDLTSNMTLNDLPTDDNQGGMNDNQGGMNDNQGGLDDSQGGLDDSQGDLNDMSVDSMNLIENLDISTMNEIIL